MSINLQVYVGPFLRCSPPGLWPGELTNDRLTDISGEREGDGFAYVGPNVAMPEIDRPMTWERTGESTAIASKIDPNSEVALFSRQFGHDIMRLGAVYETVEVLWGVVPGWF